VSIEGVIEEKLPKGLFRVRLEDGNAVKAHPSMAARRVTSHFVPGDRVLVERSVNDPTRGRITAKI